MQDLKFAIIGCGKIAPRHAEQAAKHGTIVAVCDIIKDKADSLASKFNCSAFYNINSLFDSIKDVTITAVCTPNGLHAEHSMIALNAGSHVLCEKPMSIDCNSAKKKMHVAEENKKKLF